MYSANILMTHYAKMNAYILFCEPQNDIIEEI